MWRSGRRKVERRLAAASASAAPGEPARPVEVSVLATVVSPGAVVSPLTGVRAAVVRLELLERLPAARGAPADLERYESLGVLVLGDLVTLRDDDGDEISLVARRATIQPAAPPQGAPELGKVPAEMVPMLARARGQGVLCYRELALLTNDRVLMTAVIEASSSSSVAAYRAGPRKNYVARDDLAAVVLDEVVSSPAG
jgi:hypothetical protein